MIIKGNLIVKSISMLYVRWFCQMNECYLGIRTTNLAATGKKNGVHRCGRCSILEQVSCSDGKLSPTEISTELREEEAS